MSIVFSEKTRRTRLALRWPFSRQLTLSLSTLVVLLAVWWAVAAQQWVSPLFLPPPGQVLEKLITIAGPQGFMDATLWQHLGASLMRILVALLAAVIIGVPVGIAMGLSPTVRGILDPLIELYRPVPPLAYLPLMVIWFGIGETSKILLIYLAIFAPVAMSALAGVKSAQQVRIRAAQSLGAARADTAVRHFTRRAAGDTDRAAHRPWGGLVYAGGGRADSRHARPWVYGAVGGRVPGD